jgi:signal transduction histidine kinase
VRFGRQLLIGYTALLFVTLVTGAVAVVALRVTTNHLDRVAHVLSNELIEIQRLRLEAEQTVAANRGYLLTGDARAADHANRSVALMEDALTHLQQHEPLAAGVSTVALAARRYVTVATEATAQRTKSGDPRSVLPFFESTVAPARDDLERVIGEFVGREQAAFEHESTHAHDIAEEMQVVVTVATLMGIALSGALALLWMRRLAGQYAAERQATARARRAVAARDDVLAIVSHDLRNPLSTISVGASLLDMDAGWSPLAKRHVASITTAADRMRHLIDDLLESAALDAGKLDLSRERCTLASLFDSTVALFAARAQQAEVTLVVEGRDEGLSVEADRARALQILENLVGNAFKHTPRGGRITLRALPHEGHVRVEVGDTGPGIEPDHVPHLFERYWQGRKRSKGGLGLGLYICKQIVDAHDGSIGVDTAVGKGATFWFELPRTAG